MPYKGSNAERLNGMCMYDLLCRMNEKSVRGFLCVLQMLDENQRVRTRCDDFGVDGTHYDGCRKCIAAWLYEPKEGRW